MKLLANRRLYGLKQLFLSFKNYGKNYFLKEN